MWHNARCSKSRQALQLLQQETGLDIEVFEYLKEPISSNDLEQLKKMLSITSIFEIIRKSEEAYKLYVKDKTLTEAELVDLFIAFPKLIERPVVINNSTKKAIVARPPELCLQVLR